MRHLAYCRHLYDADMEIGSLAVAIIAVVVAIISIIVSLMTALRQVRTARDSTHVNLALDVLRRYLDSDLSESEQFMRQRISAVPIVAISELPNDVRIHAVKVATLYQTVGYLAASGAVDSKTTQYLFGINAVRNWESLGPYIAAQRRADPAGVGYRFFEDFAARCSDLNSLGTVERFNLKSFR